jgi:hypothetical protein
MAMSAKSGEGGIGLTKPMVAAFLLALATGIYYYYIDVPLSAGECFGALLLFYLLSLGVRALWRRLHRAKGEAPGD